jgi:hypothetical protein
MLRRQPQILELTGLKGRTICASIRAWSAFGTACECLCKNCRKVSMAATVSFCSHSTDAVAKASSWSTFVAVCWHFSTAFRATCLRFLLLARPLNVSSVARSASLARRSNSVGSSSILFRASVSCKLVSRTSRVSKITSDASYLV